MRKKKTIIEASTEQGSEITGVGVDRVECYHFGEATVKVESVDVNAWKCTMQGGTIIGFVIYTPEYRHQNEGRGKDYGYRAFHSPSLESAEMHPATEVNRYSSLRNAVRAVVACHYSGRRYTYIHDNIAILDGRVVPESVFKGRRVIKPLLA